MWFVCVKTTEFKFEFVFFVSFFIIFFLFETILTVKHNFGIFFLSSIWNVQIVVKIKAIINKKTTFFPLFFEIWARGKKPNPLLSVKILFICLFVANETQSICHFTLEFINLIRVCILVYAICVCMCAICLLFFCCFLIFFYWSSLVPHHSQRLKRFAVDAK